MNEILKIPWGTKIEAGGNIRFAKYDYMMDLNTLIKETAWNKDFLATRKGLQNENTDWHPRSSSVFIIEFHQVSVKKVLDDKMVIVVGSREGVLYSLHFRNPWQPNMLRNASIFSILVAGSQRWRPNESKKSTSCIQTYKIAKTQLVKTHWSKIKRIWKLGEEAHLNSTGKIHNEELGQTENLYKPLIFPMKHQL